MDIRLEAASLIFSGDEEDVKKSLKFLDEQEDSHVIISDNVPVWNVFEYKDAKFLRNQIDEFEYKLSEIYNKGFSDGLAKSPDVEDEFGDC